MLAEAASNSPPWFAYMPMVGMFIYIIYTLYDDLYSSSRRPTRAALMYAPDSEMLTTLIKAWVGCGGSYKRSHELLLKSLTPAQRTSFETFGWFEVIGSHSKKIYKISAATTMNIFCEGHCYCAENYDVPIFDKILTQKILIEFDEKQFKKIANKF